MARVTGLGGIFFKARDPKALGSWYETRLHMPLDRIFAARGDQRGGN